MPRRIDEDWKDFRDVVSGRIRKSLKEYIKSGKIVTSRKNGKITISIPRIDIPQIVFGESKEGIGRGNGKKGDVIGKGKPSSSNGAGQGESDGIMISLDLEEVLKFMQDELNLPNLKKKTNDVFEEVKIKYNSISLVGPESLRHNRKTLRQTLRRQAMEGTIRDLDYVPGLKEPIPILRPINEDKRYRQYKEIKIPSSNALIIFARDGSASMDAKKCDIVSDMAWWIDVWIRRFYERVERMYVWHDSSAQEVDEDKFYKYRLGGGTTCSSALKYIASQFENRYRPEKWNIYVFYFTDGENFFGDNDVFVKTLSEQFGPDVVNFTGITQIFSYSYEDSLKHSVDQAIKNKKLNSDCVRTAEIGHVANGEINYPFMGEERNKQILDAIKILLGNPSNSGI